MLKIDFGSGYNPEKGYKTCDFTYSPFLDYAYNRSDNKIYDLEEKSVDIFRLKNVLHHCDIEKVVKCLSNYLKDDGEIIIIEPNKENYSSNRGLDILWYRYIYPRYEIPIPPVKRFNYVEEFIKNNFYVFSVEKSEIYDTYIFKKKR